MGQIATDSRDPVSGRTYSCRIRDILSMAEDDADRAIIQSRLDDEDNSHMGMSDWLAGYGLHASYGAVRAHRKGVCQCSRVR